MGRSKKEAEQQAAHEAYVRLTERAGAVREAKDASAEARAAAPREDRPARAKGA
jgi:hypothetical protein